MIGLMPQHVAPGNEGYVNQLNCNLILDEDNLNASFILTVTRLKAPV
jgi:hypothetical protein